MMLTLNGVWKSFQQGKASIPVLKGVELAVASGQSLSIVGRSGEGKSTLLALLSAVEQPDRGSVCFGETDLGQLTEEDRTIFRGKHYGIVFQQFHLIDHLTALENVTLPLEIQGDPNPVPKALALLQEVGLESRTHHKPRQLSGGEAQRVAIARALVTSPAIVLADEPTGNLDTASSEQVFQLLMDLTQKKKTTLVLVTHNPELAARCDRRYRLRDGLLRQEP